MLPAQPPAAEKQCPLPIYPGEVPGASYTEEQRELIEKEDYYRTLFATAPDAAELADPYATLWDVFAHAEDEAFRERDESAAEQRVPKLRLGRPARAATAGRAAVVSAAEFAANWVRFTRGALAGLDWRHLVAAGGAVLACATTPVGDELRAADLDLFVHGLADAEAATRLLEHVAAVLARNRPGARGHIVRTNRAVTFLGEYPHRHVQVILRLYRSPLEVLLGFDIDSCAIAFDGSRAYAMERWRRAVTARYNLVNPSRRSLTYESRLAKYAQRGFAVAVPGLRKPDVDPTALATGSLKTAQGLLKLLLYEYLALHPPPPKPARARRLPAAAAAAAAGSQAPAGSKPPAFAPEPSDYMPEEVQLPWGPEWYADQILAMLNFRDRMHFFSHDNRTSTPTTVGRTRGSQFKHRHLFVTGIEGLIEGHSFWCRLCKRKKNVMDELSGRFVGQKLTWLKDCIVYQDFERRSDTIFRRTIPLMTGSFTPAVNADFEKDVYLADVREKGEKFFSSSPLAVSLFHPPRATRAIPLSPLPVEDRATISPVRCPDCGSNFLSENLWLRHCRATGHSFASYRVPCPAPSSASSALPPLEKTAEDTVTSHPKPIDFTRASLPAHSNDLDIKRTTKLMLLVTSLAKQSVIDQDQKGALKDALLKGNDLIIAALEVFQATEDVSELRDTLRRISE